MSSYISICHQMSPCHEMSFNLTWWHLMVIWWSIWFRELVGLQFYRRNMVKQVMAVRNVKRIWIDLLFSSLMELESKLNRLTKVSGIRIGIGIASVRIIQSLEQTLPNIIFLLYMQPHEHNLSLKKWSQNGTTEELFWKKRSLFGKKDHFSW